MSMLTWEIVLFFKKMVWMEKGPPWDHPAVQSKATRKSKSKVVTGLLYMSGVYLLYLLCTNGLLVICIHAHVP
jgi:hypothetical protein